ncbi:VOC family protein [Arthrobacter humicola]
METQRRRDPAVVAPQARIAAIMVNAVNAEELAAFWAALLGTTVSARFDQFVWLKPAAPGAPQLAFQEVPDATEGRRRLHLDVHGPDPESLRAHAESLGAVFVEGHDIGDFHWNVMHDPEGNEFCIASD